MSQPQPLPVWIAAMYDQERASVASLIQAVREHRKVCDTYSCLSAEVFDLLDAASLDLLRVITHVCLYELGNQQPSIEEETYV